ncbi:MAG TPA: glycosyltransferase [Acidimicrobiia bacterium]|nr:glycosyltransferase [Acidimicrobiia bacterium]
MRRAAQLANRLPPSVRRLLKRFPGTAAAKDSLAGYPKLEPPRAGGLRPVVYLPTWARWDEMRQRPQFIVDAFAERGHDAYFVDPREERIRTVGRVTIVPTLEDTPRSEVILYVHFAPLVSLFDRYDDAVVVYDILDDLTIYDEDEVGMPEHRRVRFHHPLVMDRADVVMASAPALIDEHRSERSDILYVENGVDPTAFGGPLPAPADLPEVGGSVVGYHGMIARWFDFDLVGAVADELSEVAFLLVGPVDPSVRGRLDDLEARSNVHYLGPRLSNEIAAYVQSFDVGIVPFVVDDLTRAVSPLKMYEYMAAGVPVVATPLPVCETHPLVATTDHPRNFVRLVVEALDRSRDAAFVDSLRQAAHEASWSNRIAPVIARLDEREQLRVPS